MTWLARIASFTFLLVASALFASGGALAQTPHTVSVGGNGNVFSPSQLTITAGDTVTFHNLGGFHNVVDNAGTFRCANGCDGVGTGSGTPSGATWSSTLQFNTPGTINAHCEVHGVMMSVQIIVQPAVASFTVGPGISGSWFNPLQNGHGFAVEVLPTQPLSILAYWFVFGPDGGQAWVIGQGNVEGDHAVLQAFQGGGTGGRFPPNFDPANVHTSPWGTITFTFTDCSHGRVDYDSTVAGYGSGSFTINRLTTPAGLTCQ